MAAKKSSAAKKRKKIAAPSLIETVPMVDRLGRRLPFDSAVVGMSTRWSTLPRDGYAFTAAFGVVNRTMDGGGRPYAEIQYGKVHPDAHAAQLDALTTLLDEIYFLKKQSFAAHKMHPPMRLFENGERRLALAWTTLEKDHVAGVLMRVEGESCWLSYYEEGFADAADAAVDALVGEGFVELHVAKQGLPWAPPRLRGVLSFHGLDGSRIDLACANSFVERVRWLGPGGTLMLRARLEHLGEPDSDRRVLVVEYADGSIDVRGSYPTREGRLSFQMPLSELGDVAKYEVPDPSPLMA